MSDELQFNQVRQKISKYAISPEAKEIIKTKKCSHNLKIVKNLLDETQDMLKVLNSKLHIPFISSESINPIINKVTKGFILSPNELEKVADFVRVTKLIRRFFDQNKILAPIIYAYSTEISFLDNLEDKIYENIEHGIVSDKSNNDLAKKRAEVQKIDETIKEQLAHILNSKTLNKYLQDKIIVTKNDHYTVPVNSSFKSKINGQIIEKSNNGKTVYIEPLKIATLNSKKAQLEIAIELIEQEILAKLTVEIFEQVNDIQKNMDIIIELDVILARAKYSQSIAGKRPILNRENLVNLKQIHHPLLKMAMPLTLELVNYRGLMITGPNAGGKTVTLKTIGLAVLMTELGVFLPSDKPCLIPIMDAVYSDIGDHQDLDNSLSTFSAEMKNIAQIIKKAKPRSLILLDEVGSGTDPVEGSVLAIAILQKLQLKGCLIVATTHYSSIKDFAVMHPNFTTASMDFDLKTLTPTYQLIMNQVGQSRALEIAKQAGLEIDVIKSAQTILDSKKIPLKQSKIEFNQKRKIPKNVVRFDRGDIVYDSSRKKEVLFYEINEQKQAIIFVNKEFHTAPVKRLKLRRKAQDLYPKGYNVDFLFIKDYQDYKFNKDLDRGSKKAFKKLKKFDKNHKC